LKLSKRVPVSATTLKHYRSAVEIYDPGISTEQHIVQELINTMAKLHKFQTRHKELWSSHLDASAEAKVLKNNPNLQCDSVKHIKEGRKEKITKRLQHRENMCRSFWKIWNLLHPRSSQGLSKVNVPDPPASTTTVIDPKTWTGTWKPITNPIDLAEAIPSGS